MYNEFMIGRKKEQEEFNNIYNVNAPYPVPFLSFEKLR